MTLKETAKNSEKSNFITSLALPALWAIVIFILSVGIINNQEYGLNLIISSILIMTVFFSLFNPSRGKFQSAMVRWVKPFAFAAVSSAVLLISSETAVRSFPGVSIWFTEILPNSNTPTAFIRAFIWVFLFYSIIMLLSNGFAATLITAIFTTGLGVASYYKIIFRHSPVSPWDLYALPTLLSVGDSGFFEADSSSVILAISIALLMVVLSMPIASPVKWRSLKGLCAKKSVRGIKVYANKFVNTLYSLRKLLVTGVFVTVFLVFNAYFIFGGYSFPTRSWTIFAAYNEQGYVISFLNDLKRLRPSEPKNYSKKAVLDIVEKIPDESKRDAYGKNKKPNIIAVMSESFIDIEKQIPNAEYGTEITPNLHRLQEETLSGNVLTSTYGGGTSLSEFQFLTGFSTNELPDDYVPYMQGVTKDTYSYPRYLKEKGYKTIAQHPGTQNSWNRNVAYPYLDFDEYHCIDDYDNPIVERGLTSDKSVVDKLIKDYENHLETKPDTPLFMFAITIQNHSPFYGVYPRDELVDVEMDGLTYVQSEELRDYATAMQSADRQIGRLFDYFNEREEPVVVVYFGDHGAQTHLKYEASNIVPPSALKQEYERSITPFVAWNNFSEMSKKNINVVGLSNLLSLVLEEYDLPAPSYFRYLQQSMEISPGVSRTILLHSNRTYSYIGEEDSMSEEEKQLLNELAILRYDHLFGKRYSSEIFPIN